MHWLLDNLVFDESLEVEVGVVCETIQRELQEVVANSVIGKCLQPVSCSKVNNPQNSKIVRCYYRVKFEADAVHGELTPAKYFQVPATRDQDDLTEEANKKLQPQNNTLQLKDVSGKLRY